MSQAWAYAKATQAATCRNCHTILANRSMVAETSGNMLQRLTL